MAMRTPPSSLNRSTGKMEGHSAGLEGDGAQELVVEGEGGDQEAASYSQNSGARL